jgi:hypothetical protein
MKKIIAIPFITILLILMTGCEESIIPDDEAPVISLIGDEDIYIFVDSVFSDPGVNVSDNVDLDVTLVVSGLDFDTSLVDIYYIYYNAIDDAGNVALEVVRRVHVEYDEPEVPVINLIGEEDIYIIVGTEYIDQGATVSDNLDLDLTLIVSGLDFDTSLTNIYNIYYNAVDADGNIALEVVRRVHVTYNEPGVITSFTYESFSLIGVSVGVFDSNDVLVTLYANLYDGNALIASVEITESSQGLQFTGLVTGVDYTLVVEGTYNLGHGQEDASFSKTPITVGVYKKISEDLRIDIGNDIVFDALYELLYLPYDSSEYTKSKIMILTLATIDEELLLMFAESNERIVFSNTWINYVYDYFHLRGSMNYPIVYGKPSAVMIGYSGTSINVTLQLMGMMYADSVIEDVFDQKFIDIFIVEADIMFPYSRYNEDSYQYFIECFAYYYLSDSSNQELLDNAPRTHAYIEALITHSIEEYLEN